MRAADIRERLADIIGRHAPQHLVHVGAHEGEEVLGYLVGGVPRVTLVEPHPALAERLRRRYANERRVTVVEAACSDAPGEVTLYVPARTNMATVHAEMAGATAHQVAAVRLDEVAPDADAAVIDVQGHELAVLAAAPWSFLHLVIVETCTVDDPLMSARHDEVEAVMTARGFRQVAVFPRDYRAVVRWATGITPSGSGEVRDVVYVRAE